MKLQFIAHACLLCIVVPVEGYGPGPDYGSALRVAQSADICDCYPRVDEETQTPYGCCTQGLSPWGVAADGLDPKQAKLTDKQLEFYKDLQDDTGSTPGSIHLLSTSSKGIPAGSYGPNCNEHCVWRRPYRVLVPYSRLGWVHVYQSLDFRQWITVCSCARRTCQGFFYYYFHWTAYCKQVFTYRALYVWIYERYPNHKTYQPMGRYVIKLKWFRFPSACACGNPHTFYVKFGGAN